MPASEPENSPANDRPNPQRSTQPSWPGRLVRIAGWSLGAVVAGLVTLLLIVGVALAVAYPNLPNVGSLTDYRPKLPLRVYSADGVMLG